LEVIYAWGMMEKKGNENRGRKKIKEKDTRKRNFQGTE